MSATGLFNFTLSYSLWANYGSPRCLLHLRQWYSYLHALSALRVPLVHFLRHLMRGSCRCRIFLLVPGIAALGFLMYHGMTMNWLKCSPVERPENNLANWIQMRALDTEHGRVALYSLGAYSLLLLFDSFVSMVCCCCFEEMPDDDGSRLSRETAAGGKIKAD